MAEINWIDVRTEYITTLTSYRKLADKYGVSFRTLSERAKQEGWRDARAAFRENLVTKAVQKAENRQADRMARIDKAADRLLSKLERAIDELDLVIATKKTKTKDIEYNNGERPDKPTREVVVEEETVETVSVMVDRAGLRMITAALKDLKEVKMIRSELDQQEQEARIANLRRQAESEEKDSDTKLEIVGLPEEFKV